jgi:hypothetical protein
MKNRFRVGDRVGFLFGRRRVIGVIVEDRGPLGMQGRRLYRIEFTLPPAEPMFVEIPEDEIEPETAKA